MRDGNVVVIGGGYAGVRPARKLDAAAHVTLVDRKEVFFHRIASLRAGVRPEWTGAPFIPYDRLLVHDRPVVGKAVRIDTVERRVTLATGDRLPSDVLVVATGAVYPEPARFVGTTPDEAAKAFAERQHGIAAAGHILVVGGGPSGGELSAEIRLARPDARVALAHSGQELLHSTGSARAGRRARTWLTAHDVSVRLDSFVSPGADFGTYRDTHGGILAADLSFWATGTTPNTLWLRLAGHGDWLTGTGHVKVDRTLRVEGRPDVCAVGDVNDVTELKVTPAALAQAEVAAHNILSHLRGSGRHGNKLRTYRAVRRTPLIVPFGPADGVTVLPVPLGESAVLGTRATTTAKAKTLTTPYMRRRLGYPSA